MKTPRSLIIAVGVVVLAATGVATARADQAAPNTQTVLNPTVNPTTEPYPGPSPCGPEFDALPDWVPPVQETLLDSLPLVGGCTLAPPVAGQAFQQQQPRQQPIRVTKKFGTINVAPRMFPEVPALRPGFAIVGGNVTISPAPGIRFGNFAEVTFQVNLAKQVAIPIQPLLPPPNIGGVTPYAVLVAAASLSYVEIGDGDEIPLTFAPNATGETTLGRRSNLACEFGRAAPNDKTGILPDHLIKIQVTAARADVFIGNERTPVEVAMPASDLAPIIRFGRCAAGR